MLTFHSPSFTVGIKDTLKGNVFLNYPYETHSVPLYFEDMKVAISPPHENTHVTVSVILLCALKNLGIFSAIPFIF